MALSANMLYLSPSLKPHLHTLTRNMTASSTDTSTYKKRSGIYRYES